MIVYLLNINGKEVQLVVNHQAESQRIEIASVEELALALCEAQAFLGGHCAHFGRSVMTLTRCDYSTGKQRAYFDAITRGLETSVLWHGITLSAKEWGDLIIAAWRKELLVPGMLGGLAFVGGSVRDLSREHCSEVLFVAEEFLHSIGLTLTALPPSPITVFQHGSELADLRVLSHEATPAVEQEPPHAHHTLRRWGSVCWRGSAPALDELQ